ncbi:MAG TPA: 2TM domain-containing protein [Thermomicrobiales bacterium]|jgi:hypothetical protein
MCKQRVRDVARTPPSHDGRRQAFIGHALTFALVIGGLAVLNLATSPGYPWFLWPLFGWGIGLAKQGASVFQARAAVGGESTLDPPGGVSPFPESPETAARPWPDLE